ncbi:MAG: methyltransferase domain-containing protein [Gammaproteobacteria bacterium]|nr:methyltransferase domain-containing protein [Gammaproteobacteria bacterium]
MGDFGCGNGRGATYLAKTYNSKIIGIDINPAQIVRAEEYNRQSIKYYHYSDKYDLRLMSSERFQKTHKTKNIDDSLKEGAPLFEVNEDGNIKIWQWDNRKKTLVQNDQHEALNLDNLPNFTLDFDAENHLKLGLEDIKIKADNLKLKNFIRSIGGNIPSNRLQFIQGDIANTPFPNDSFSNIVSVEVLQHCSHLPAVLSEVARVLKPGGTFTATTFFATSKSGVEKIKSDIPNWQIMCSDLTIDEVGNLFSQYLTDIEIESIGPEVWYGLYCWLNHVGYGYQWTVTWTDFFRQELLDYYVLKGKSLKPQLEAMPKFNNEDECEDENYTPKFTM